MIKAGITGGIGTGKTTVCRIFETLGISVFYADEEAKKILHNDEQAINRLRNFFGDGVFTSGLSDRKKIADIVFRDPEKLQQLNSILHPATFSKYEQWISEKGNAVYTLMESALIYESKADTFLDKVIVVSAPVEIRIQRIMKRDKVSETDVKARINNQLNAGALRQKADFEIINDESQLLISQVIKIHEQLNR